MCRMHEPEYMLVRKSAHKAKSIKQCNECKRPIKIDEYYINTGYSDFVNDFTHHRFCQHCWSCVNWLTDVCSMFQCGEIIDEIEEHHQEKPDDPHLLAIVNYAASNPPWAGVQPEQIQQLANDSRDLWLRPVT